MGCQGKKEKKNINKNKKKQGFLKKKYVILIIFVAQFFPLWVDYSIP